MQRRSFLALIPVAWLAACSSDSSGPSPQPPPPPPPPPSGGIGANMSIIDNAFVDPNGGQNGNATVTVASGQAVRWTNNGVLVHTVTSTSVPSGASAFDSGNIAIGGTFDRTFTVAGTYMYRCDSHPQEMLGATVVVT